MLRCVCVCVCIVYVCVGQHRRMARRVRCVLQHVCVVTRLMNNDMPSGLHGDKLTEKEVKSSSVVLVNTYSTGSVIPHRVRGNHIDH